MITGVRHRGRRAALVILLLAAVTVASIGAVGVLGGYRINTTPSFALGLWRIDALTRDVRVGDIVFICPPAHLPAIKLARERLYLPAGLCEGGIAPLIKTVAALPGQTVSTKEGFAVIDSIRLSHSAVHKRDGQGRTLPGYAGGRIASGMVYVHSNYVASYDSRYFGPIPASGILGLAREVLTFQP